MSLATRCRKLSLAVPFMLMAPGCGDYHVGPIQATACNEEFVACGGNPTGDWDLFSLCVDGDLTAALDMGIAVQEPSCTNTLLGANLSGGGSVSYLVKDYSDPVVTYADEFATASTASFPPAWSSALAGGASSDTSVCKQVQTNLSNQPGTDATCSLTDGNCVCQATVTTRATQTHSYTLNGTTITEDGEAPYSYCAKGNSMLQRRLIDGNTYKVIKLQKRVIIASPEALPNNG